MPGPRFVTDHVTEILPPAVALAGAITFVAIKGSSPREVIIPARPDGTPGQAGPNYSPAIKVGNRLFVSGGTGTTDANKGDMKA